MLQIAVVHERQRFGVARAEQENQAAVPAALHAIFVFDHEAVLIFPGEHVRFHANRENAELARGAFHRAPAIIVRLVRHVEIDARPVTRALLVKLPVSVFHRLDGGFHVEHLLDMFVG